MFYAFVLRRIRHRPSAALTCGGPSPGTHRAAAPAYRRTELPSACLGPDDRSCRPRGPHHGIEKQFAQNASGDLSVKSAAVGVRSSVWTGGESPPRNEKQPILSILKCTPFGYIHLRIHHAPPSSNGRNIPESQSYKPATSIASSRLLISVKTRAGLTETDILLMFEAARPSTSSSISDSRPGLTGAALHSGWASRRW